MEKQYKIFKVVFTIFFVIFLTLYFSQLAGYYEYHNYQKMVMTEEMIKKFEDDIKNGKEIDIENYVDNTNKNYQNKISSLGLSISNFISKNISNGVIKTFSYISNMVDEKEEIKK